MSTQLLPAPAPAVDVLDDLDFDLCPLCDVVIDHCQGHGAWNSSETVRACEVRVDDMVWMIGKVARIETRDRTIILVSEAGAAAWVAPDAPLQVLDAEEG